MPTNNDEFDYQGHTRQTPPDMTAATRGPAARQARHRKVRKQAVTIRLDADIIDAFKKLTEHSTGRGYQTIINQALREWLHQKDLREIVRDVVREELGR